MASCGAKVARHYSLCPPFVLIAKAAVVWGLCDKDTFEVRKFEGNPAHPGSRGRNCAKGPATHNQIYDPERILYPLKRVGKRGEGKWERISWDQALEEVVQMRESRQRDDGIMYHVGRPGEDHFTNRAIAAWGVDGHQPHQYLLLSGARFGYWFWGVFDRPSPDHANAKVILLISSHLETGHYFNPMRNASWKVKITAKLITLDPRMSTRRPRICG